MLRKWHHYDFIDKTGKREPICMIESAEDDLQTEVDTKFEERTGRKVTECGIAVWWEYM